MIQFNLPPIRSENPVPIWNGSAFQNGSECVKVLKYSSNSEGWNDDLTNFHEDSIGENHFIDCASRNYTIQQLKKNIQNESSVILEVGCSSGFMLERIQKEFPHSTILGSDVIHEALEKLAGKLPGVPLFQFDITQCPLPDNSIDAVVLLNVLEHIENDSSALKQIFRILKPGGIAIIEVPAGPHLYDFYDKYLKHFRRYNLKDLNALIKNHGFDIIKKTHLGFFFYPGFWFTKKQNQKFNSLSDGEQREKVKLQIKSTGENKILHMLMQTELFLGQYVNYMFGVRCLITCKKK